MSAPLQQTPTTLQQPPVQVKSVLKNVLHRFKSIQTIPVKPFLEDVITCFSIIGAFQYVSLSYEQQSQIEKWTSIEFSNRRTEAILLLIFAVYLISLKIIYKVAYKYDTAPPRKIIPDNWEEMEETQQTPEPTPSPSQQQPLPPASYSLMVQQLINNSIYGFVFMFCTTAYTYISMFNKKTKLVNIEQVNYLIFWFVTANIFYSVGKLVGKITGVRSFHHFGFMVGLFVVAMEIGLAHGFNTFVFI